MGSVFGSFVRQWLKAPTPHEAMPVNPARSAASELLTAPASAQARPNDQVRAWKAAWVSGAESRWAAQPLLTNPHTAGSSRAAAWRAGWHWAERQPDRREPSAVRFAHQYRRSTDQSFPRVRRTQAAAVGLSALTIAGWLWHIRRQRNRRERQS